MYGDVYFLTHEQLHLLSSFLFLDLPSIELVLCAKRRLHRNSSPLPLSPTGLIFLHSCFFLTPENSKCRKTSPPILSGQLGTETIVFPLIDVAFRFLYLEVRPLSSLGHFSYLYTETELENTNAMPPISECRMLKSICRNHLPSFTPTLCP